MLWGRFVEWIDLAVLGVGYVATCLGITVGFHRLLTHRSFQTYPAVRYALAVLGTLAVEGSVIKWVADHRKHHAFTDQQGDPHSPHEAGPGVSGALSGLWHAHVGWLFNSVGQADRRRYAADLLKDPGLRRIDGAEKPLIVASLAIPFLLGLLVKGTFTGALVTLVWGGLVRVLVASRDVQHQLDLPLLRPETLRDPGPLHQRGLAVARDARRVLAQQPPRVSHIRVPRPPPPRARPRGRLHQGPRAGRTRRLGCESSPECANARRLRPGRGNSQPDDEPGVLSATSAVATETHAPPRGPRAFAFAWRPAAPLNDENPDSGSHDPPLVVGATRRGG